MKFKLIFITLVYLFSSCEVTILESKKSLFTDYDSIYTKAKFGPEIDGLVNIYIENYIKQEKPGDDINSCSNVKPVSNLFIHHDHAGNILEQNTLPEENLQFINGNGYNIRFNKKNQLEIVQYTQGYQEVSTTLVSTHSYYPNTEMTFKFFKDNEVIIFINTSLEKPDEPNIIYLRDDKIVSQLKVDKSPVDYFKIEESNEFFLSETNEIYWLSSSLNKSFLELTHLNTSLNKFEKVIDVKKTGWKIKSYIQSDTLNIYQIKDDYSNGNVETTLHKINLRNGTLLDSSPLKQYTGLYSTVFYNNQVYYLAKTYPKIELVEPQTLQTISDFMSTSWTVSPGTCKSNCSFSLTEVNGDLTLRSLYTKYNPDTQLLETRLQISTANNFEDILITESSFSFTPCNL